MPTVIPRIASIGTVAALAFGLIAVAIKGGGTTARLHEIVYLFVPSFIFALALLIVARRTHLSSALTMLVSSFFGMLFPLYLHATGTLVDYETMLRGGRVPNDHPIGWLALYAGLFAAAMIGARAARRRLLPQGG